VLTFTYNGITETIYNEALFSEEGFQEPFVQDLSKPWFSWKNDGERYRIYLGFGRDNDAKTTQKRLFLLYAKKPNSSKIDEFGFYIYDKEVVLKDKKIEITYSDKKYVSGNFYSDKINGTFEKIRYNTVF
jgi:hypothetical protein